MPSALSTRDRSEGAGRAQGRSDDPESNRRNARRRRAQNAGKTEAHPQWVPVSGTRSAGCFERRKESEMLARRRSRSVCWVPTALRQRSEAQGRLGCLVRNNKLNMMHVESATSM